MATQHGHYEFTLVDERGTLASQSWKLTLDDTKTLAEVITDIQALQALVVPLTTGGWVRQEVRMTVANAGGASATPGTDADAEEGANWNFKNATTPYVNALRVPAVADAIIAADRINAANTDVAAFEAAAIVAAANGTRLIGRDFYPFTAVKDTFLSTRKNRGPLHARSLDKR